ncbi:MAG: tyrosine-type recombinase/integrase [Planctomycetota bacterium]
MTRQPYYVSRNTKSPHCKWNVEWPNPNTGKIKVTQCFKKKDGVPPSKQTQAKARARARQLYEQWMAKHAPRRARAGEPTLRELLDLAVSEQGKSRMPGGPGSKTQQTRRTHFNTFLRFIEERVVHRNGVEQPFANGLAREVTVLLVDAFVAERRAKVMRGTIQREITSIRRAFQFGRERWPDTLGERGNPVRIKSEPRSPVKEHEEVRAKAYTEPEIARMIEICREGYTGTAKAQRVVRGKTTEEYELPFEVPPRPHLADALEFLSETGARVGEANNLQKSDIKMVRGRMRVMVCEGNKKGVPEPLTSLTDHAQEILERRRKNSPSTYIFLNERGRPFKDGGLAQAIRRLAKSLGIENRGSSRGFRHAFGLRWASLVQIHELKKLMRHTSITTTQIYIEPRDEELETKFRALDRRVESTSKRHRVATERRNLVTIT